MKIKKWRYFTRTEKFWDKEIDIHNYSKRRTNVSPYEKTLKYS